MKTMQKILTLYPKNSPQGRTIQQIVDAIEENREEEVLYFLTHLIYNASMAHLYTSQLNKISQLVNNYAKRKDINFLKIALGEVEQELETSIVKFINDNAQSTIKEFKNYSTIDSIIESIKKYDNKDHYIRIANTPLLWNNSDQKMAITIKDNDHYTPNSLYFKNNKIEFMNTFTRTINMIHDRNTTVKKYYHDSFISLMEKEKFKKKYSIYNSGMHLFIDLTEELLRRDMITIELAQGFINTINRIDVEGIHYRNNSQPLSENESMFLNLIKECEDTLYERLIRIDNIYLHHLYNSMDNFNIIHQKLFLSFAIYYMVMTKNNIEAALNYKTIGELFIYLNDKITKDEDWSKNITLTSINSFTNNSIILIKFIDDYDFSLPFEWNVNLQQLKN